MEGLISIPDFMAHLKDNGLVIVNANDIAMASDYERRELQRKLMKKKVISFPDVIRAGFLPLKSVDGIHHWVRGGKVFIKGEVYQQTNNRWVMATAALKRLGYAE